MGGEEMDEGEEAEVEQDIAEAEEGKVCVQFLQALVSASPQPAW